MNNNVQCNSIDVVTRLLLPLSKTTNKELRTTMFNDNQTRWMQQKKPALYLQMQQDTPI